LPRHAGRILRRCLAKDPDRRYQTALDLRNELEELKAEIDSGLHEASSHGTPARRWWSTRRRVVLGAGAVLVIAALFPILQWVRRESPDPETYYTSIPLTSAIGSDSDPSWSPEGEFIAFAQQAREGSYDVMVRPAAAGEAVVRAGGPGDEVAPRWSPDGRYMAYISTSEPGTFVYLVPPHGGTPRKLIETGIGALDVDFVWMSMGDRPWASDSRTLLISRMNNSGRLAIYRVDRDNGAAEQLSFPPVGSDDHSASYSFDGESIAFVRGSASGGALMTMPAAGGDPDSLQVDGLEPAFRPDGRHLLFLSGRRGAANLWELDLETGALSQLTHDYLQQVWYFSVSATNLIAYGTFWHDTFLFVVDVTTGERRQLTWHTNENYGACFSPDGGTIAYTSSRTGSPEVFLHRLDGRPETQVTDDPGEDAFHDWSPDGRQLIFSSNRQDDQPKLFIANNDGGGVRLLVDQPVSDSAPSRWSPDGKRIAYLVTDDESTSLWTIGPDGNGAMQVIQDVESFDWYRDSRHGIYTRRNGSHSEMIAIHLETGEEQSLYVGPFMEMDVAPDGSAVAFCFGPGHMSMGLALLKLEPPVDPEGLPRAAGEPEYVVRTEGTWHVHNGGWSPDSKSLVYTRDQDYGDIHKLVERR
jgi:Tol biopolymer transport system component